MTDLPPVPVAAPVPGAPAPASPFADAPVFEGVRHEPRRRELTVASVERLTPHMIRVAATGEALADFASLAPDDHVKVIVPGPGGAPVMRDYTPRAFDRQARTLTLDFAVHEAGPATAWALAARPGDPLTLGGPRGSRVLRGAVGRWLLVGDETALPAIARRIEELPAGTPVETLVAVPGPADAQVARALRAHLAARGQPLPWMKAAGYWAAGRADASEKDIAD